jgi:rRNA maturation RNase YbeY
LPLIASPKNAKITFFAESISYTLPNKKIVRQWLTQICTSKHHHVGEITYIFCDDAYLLVLNKQFLQHNTFTDIITFDNTSKTPTQKKNWLLSAEIFISVERVRENAQTFNTTFLNELHRVMAHGLLHLCGYKDKTTVAKKIMRMQEDMALEAISKMLA